MLPLDEERDTLRQFVAAQEDQASILASVAWPVVKAFSSELNVFTPAALLDSDKSKSNNPENAQNEKRIDGLPTTRQSSLVLLWLKNELLDNAHAVKNAGSAEERQRLVKELSGRILAYDYSIMLQIGDRFIEGREMSWDGAGAAETHRRREAYQKSVRTCKVLVEKLFTANVRIVLEATESIRSSSPHLKDEAVTWANYGLLSAIYRYWTGHNEGGKDTRLYTYAVNRIKFYLVRFLQKDKAGDIRMTASHLEKKIKIRKAAEELGIDLMGELAKDDIAALAETSGLAEESIIFTLRNDFRVDSFSALAAAAGTEIWEPIPEYQRPSDQVEELSTSIDLSHLPHLLRQIRDMDAIEQFALSIEYNTGNCAEAALAVYRQRRTKLQNKMNFVMVAPSARRQRIQVRIQRLG